MTAACQEQLSTGAERSMDGHTRLDNLTLAHKEGWRSFAEARARTQPERLTTTELRRLGGAVADFRWCEVQKHYSDPGSILRLRSSASRS